MMKAVRILAIVMLAFLYLGGTWVHLSGAAFPILGTGNKAYDGFEGKTHDPVHPRITECRHLPLVKSLEISPVLADTQTAFPFIQEYRTATYSCVAPALCSACTSSCCDRAPPRS